jgi:hypothetical protein
VLLYLMTKKRDFSFFPTQIRASSRYTVHTQQKKSSRTGSLVIPGSLVCETGSCIAVRDRNSRLGMAGDDWGWVGMAGDGWLGVRCNGGDGSFLQILLYYYVHVPWVV